MNAVISKFKYAAQLEQLPILCPAQNASEVNATAYRWVHNPISQNCFLPQALRNPRRLHAAKDAEERCSCWALSLHGTLNASVEAFQGMERSFKNARKIFGGWVAKGHLTSSHGVCTPADHNNHFDLHEYKGASVAAAFSAQQSIPKKP
jgi:hypothetical protein